MFLNFVWRDPLCSCYILLLLWNGEIFPGILHLEPMCMLEHKFALPPVAVVCGAYLLLQLQLLYAALLLYLSKRSL